MCKSGQNQTGRERDPPPVWAHTSKKTSNVGKKLPYKYSTSSFPSKSCQSQRMEEKTGVEGTCRLSQPVRESSHGHDSPWLNWRCLNRLRTGYTCSKEQRKKWGYFNGDPTCECGLATENTSHMLQCTLLEEDSLMIRHDDDDSHISVYHSYCESLHTVCISDLSMRTLPYIHMDRSSPFPEVVDISPVSEK